MLYAKAALAGVFGAIVAALGWVLAVFVLPIAASLLVSRVRQYQGEGGVGVGAAYASISSASVLLVAAVGFLAGVYWTITRARKRP